MPAWEVTVTARWGDGTTIGLPNRYAVTVNNLPLSPDRADPVDQTPSSTQRFAETVTITPGTVEGWTFMRWDVTGVAEYTVENNVLTFTMPAGEVVATARWGDGENLDVPREYDVTVSNNPPHLLPLGQTTSNSARFAETVEINLGTMEGWSFEKWEVAGVSEYEWNETTRILTFTMPAGEVTVTANWTQIFTLTFHHYDGSDEYVVVEVLEGEPVDLAKLPDFDVVYGESGIYPGYVFRGWFTDETLNASGRRYRNIGTNRRRPLPLTQVSEDTNFNLSIVITPALFEGDKTNLDLYAIWSLWGDVNGDDEVNLVDYGLLLDYITWIPNTIINKNAAKVIVESDPNAPVGLADLGLLLDYINLIPGRNLGVPVAR
jgi:hypothetical protein